MFGVISSKVPAYLKKILQIFEWNPSKFEEFNANSNVLIQPFELISPNSKLFSINIWLNFFKIHFQNTKKRKEEGAGGEPETLWSIFWCCTPVPIWILKEEGGNKRRQLETGILLKKILQTVKKILHLMRSKIESWNEVKKAFWKEST